MTKISTLYEPDQDLLNSLTYKVVEWCITRFCLQEKVERVTIDISGLKIEDWWGDCIEDDENEACYIININPRQSLRDFVATIVHEMVHVKQWATGQCQGEGEREANRLQYELTDIMWKENVV